MLLLLFRELISKTARDYDQRGLGAPVHDIKKRHEFFPRVDVGAIVGISHEYVVNGCIKHHCGSNELLEQLSQQKDAPQADVMFGGGVESLESYRELFEPYACTDAAHPDGVTHPTLGGLASFCAACDSPGTACTACVEGATLMANGTCAPW